MKEVKQSESSRNNTRGRETIYFHLFGSLRDNQRCSQLFYPKTKAR